MSDSQKLTKSVASKFTETDFQKLRLVAAHDRKCAAACCRDKILEAIQPRSIRPSEYAIMAEIRAKEAILIDLLCAIGRDGKLSQQKAQSIVDAAHSAKYKEAAKLLKCVYTQLQSGRLETAPGQSTACKG